MINFIWFFNNTIRNLLFKRNIWYAWTL